MAQPQTSGSSSPSTAQVAGWEPLRRPPRHNDEALTGTTRHWLRRLPVGRRPLRLCEQFPRVANRIAWHWRDPQAAAEVLDDLLIDRRGGRAGFPKPIVLELRRLRDFNERTGQRRDTPDADSERPHGYLDALRQLWSGH